ncbi:MULTISPECIES: WGR domain-containing protein [Sphingomonadaceae]|jgi:predicted DNA-binding WGR domain protein|uniref:WGR domain-containing protein, predicted DNA-binding domain in MolR n=1 Tax=Novosphingobium panipatense TaxID=428991 RepID=A0ABY1QTR3_9SPHN|nr:MULTISPECIES: WGR domain-containing protein [Sphingomonadaceae]SMP80708.1 WGR domain-containing protein, predicted DNA-binding domain in MolR [Novosphingobium panipatense]
MHCSFPALFVPIELIALDHARNIRRRYEIVVTRDLFGSYIVETSWGRIGAHGRSKRLSFPDRPSAERHVAATLRRRGTAKKRIGVPYLPSPFCNRPAAFDRTTPPALSPIADSFAERPARL